MVRKCVGKGLYKIGEKCYNYSIDHYYAKYDFEADRKSGKLGVFIIQQNAEYKREIRRTSESYYRNKIEFDKSGCNITEAREQLQYRLRKYKEDKRKREVDAISYEADLKEIKGMFQVLKEKLIIKLSEAKTSKEYDDIRYVFDFNFVWMVRDIGQLEKKVTQNSFCSIKEATDSIANLKEKIAEKTRKIEGY